MSKEWREFEKLVARIESAAAPLGAVVKSPDRIREVATGIMQQVDASIRYRVGTADVLIIVECRKRGRKGGKPWIDELAARRQAIGASKTIAVSSTGFTAPAIVSAQHHGIDLRTLAEVTASDISRWFLSGAVHVCRYFEDIRCAVVLYDDSGEASKYAFNLEGEDVERPMFTCSWIHSPFPIRDLLPVLEAAQPHLFTDIPLDGKRVELELPVQWDVGEMELATTEGTRAVYLTKLTVTASYQSAICDIEAGLHHEYKSPEGVKVQHSTFQSRWLGRSVVFRHQSSPNGSQSVAAQFGPERKDEGPA